jgi:hypothetical protein
MAVVGAGVPDLRQAEADENRKPPMRSAPPPKGFHPTSCHPATIAFSLDREKSLE